MTRVYDISLTVVCSECGELLDIECLESHYEDYRITVRPCDNCTAQTGEEETDTPSYIMEQ